MTTRDMALILRDAFPHFEMVPDINDGDDDTPRAVYRKAANGQYCWLTIDPTWGVDGIRMAGASLDALVNENGGPAA